MQTFLEILMYCIIGAALIFGYTIFFRGGLPFLGKSSGKKSSGGKPGQNSAGVINSSSVSQDDEERKKSKLCPVCNTKLYKEESVSSSAFPSFNGEERFMHIKGCPYCLKGNNERSCPVCKSILDGEDILIARLFEKPGKRVHVHVIGCSRCRKTGKAGK